MLRHLLIHDGLLFSTEKKCKKVFKFNFILQGSEIKNTTSFRFKMREFEYSARFKSIRFKAVLKFEVYQSNAGSLLQLIGNAFCHEPKTT